jgi:prepilin-type processing-associated H-X9-DG protein
MANLFTRKMSLGEIVILIFAVLLFLIFIVYSLGGANGDSYQRAMDMSNMRQLMIGIHAYGIDNLDYGPGLDDKGKILGRSVEGRYRLIVGDGYTTSEVLISPYEDEKTIWTTGVFSSNNYSYAMLQLPDEGVRLSAWRLDAEPEAVWLSGRNAGTDAASGVMSIRTDDPGEWRGPVAWADGHVTTEDDQYVDTKFQSDGTVISDDNLFEAVGDDDAYMIYTGE